MYGYIYKTTNLINGKIYIGQKKSDLYLAEKYLGSGKKLWDSIKHHGKENYKVDLIEEIFDVDKMDEREIYWISYYDSTNEEIGYNLSTGGNVNRTLVGKNNGFYGKKHSEETRNKLKEAWRINPSARHFGHTISEEQKENIRKANKGRKPTAEQIEKWRESRKGYKTSEETKRKLSEIKKGTNTWVKGTTWIHNEIESKMVSENELKEYLEQGYVLGRKQWKECWKSCKDCPSFGWTKRKLGLYSCYKYNETAETAEELNKKVKFILKNTI